MNQSLLAHIGTSEVVSLPEYGLENLLAKIDTGADSSAIWASNIAEIDGSLCFTLFGPSSPHYSGEQIKTRKYSLVTVKNSFGQKEVRYKVGLKLRMADRTINARITLANRANNRFSLLIGRRTLKGKFLVDVSKKNALAGNQRVLFLIAKRSSANEKFIAFVKSEDIELKSVAYDDLVFITGGESNKIVIADSGEDIADFALAFFRTSKVYGHQYVSASIAQYLESRNVDYIDHEVIQCPTPAKLYQYILLTDNNIPIPKTIFMLPSRMRTAYEKIITELGSPFILKDTQGFKGQNNFLIESKSQYERTLKQAEDLGAWMLAQCYIPNSHDYRLLVMGGQVALVIQRTRGSDETHLNNVSTGGSANLEELSSIPSHLVNTAVAAAKLLRLQIAGVDIVQDKNTKLWYCLEVNKSPQIYTGAFIDQKQTAIAKYLSQRLYN